MDNIVFSQPELESALASGCKSICLCDGGFHLGVCGGVSFIAIGSVTVTVLAPRAECEAADMLFLNFEPKYQSGAFVPLRNSGLTVGSGSAVFGSGSSFSSVYKLAGSYSVGSSYRTSSGGSFSSVYKLAGSYSIGGSYRLRTGSLSSYTARFASSYAYSFSGSFSSSFGTSFKRTSGILLPAEASSLRLPEEDPPEYIRVFGYGIDLI